MAGAYMTDTPRTQAELLSIFADAQPSGSITPQDMRDFVVTTNPGPLYAAFSRHTQYKDGVTVLATLPAASAHLWGDNTALPWNAGGGVFDSPAGPDFISDSYTLAGSDPTSAYGIDIDANVAWFVPPGIWEFAVFSQVTIADAYTFPASVATMSPYELIFDQVRYDPDADTTDGTVPYLYDAFYNPVGYTRIPPYITAFSDGDPPGYGRIGFQHGRIINDKDSPQPFALYGYTQPGWEADVHLVYYALDVTRVA
jgi:hypothetical protein